LAPCIDSTADFRAYKYDPYSLEAGIGGQIQLNQAVVLGYACGLL